MRKGVITTVVVLTLLLPFALLAFDNDDAIAVEVAEAEKKPIERVVLASARFEYRDRAAVKSEVLGRIEKLTVKEGDKVSKGDLLIQLKDEQARLALEVEQRRLKQKRLDVRRQNVVVERLRRDFQRKKSLLKQGVINEQAFEEAEYRLREEEVGLEALKQAQRVQEALVEKARREVAKHSTLAPLDGIVVTVNVSEGEIVSGAQVFGDLRPAIVIADPDSVFAQAYVGESARSDIRIGQEVSLFPATYEEGEVRGRIRSISLQAQEVEGKHGRYFPVEVEITSDSSGHLFAGVSARVEIVAERSMGGAVIPVQSVLQSEGDATEGGSFVFVYVQGTADKRKVELGVRDDFNWEVESGLKAGTKVITGPHRALARLHDGASVALR